jgi:hypothetical protein
MTNYRYTRKEITDQLKNLISMEPKLIKGIVNDLLAVKKPSAVKEKKLNIGALRQWFNEFDGSRMVTNHDIEVMLGITPPQPSSVEENKTIQQLSDEWHEDCHKRMKSPSKPRIERMSFEERCIRELEQRVGGLNDRVLKLELLNSEKK